MIKLNGSLSVKSISGRNGVFSVGKLITTVGEFTVKDTILDQYPEGKYDGEFLVSKIFPCSYVMRGNVVVEVRAILDEVIISKSIEEFQQQEPAVADPIEEALPASNIVQAEPLPTEVVVLLPALEFGSEQAKQDYELLGEELYNILAYSGDIKLDPTVDRAKFRAQCKRLGKLGYTFKASTQTWILS